MGGRIIYKDAAPTELSSAFRLRPISPFSYVWQVAAKSDSPLEGQMPSLDYTETVGFGLGMFVARWVFALMKGVISSFAGVSMLCMVGPVSGADSSKIVRVGYQKSGALLLTKSSG